MARIKIDGLTKLFEDGDSGEVVDVDDLDLEIREGEFLILVGPSGCGKTTTLRSIAGLEKATEGNIYFDDEDVTGLDPKERNIAMVFQNYALYPHMSARDNMSFSLKYATELDSSEIQERVEETADLLGIADLIDKKPGELSGGQQQRVSLGRSIVREPDVFLMDEPLSNLDAKLRSSMRAELQEIQETLGTTTIYVTHDQEEAMTMGDRIAILRDGSLQQVGTPLECYHEPANQFVAGFIGSPSMNFFNVTNQGSVLQHSEFDYILSSELSEQIQDDLQTLTLGIRPEDIEFLDEPTENSISVEVNVIEPMGDQTNVYVEIGDGQYIVTAPGDVKVEEKDQLMLNFPEDRIHLFNGRTGEAIKNRNIELSKRNLSPQVQAD
ncbi:MAG: ABC transporter ATP-binding protein [Halobacteriaceae archaeon]